MGKHHRFAGTRHFAIAAACALAFAGIGQTPALAQHHHGHGAQKSGAKAAPKCTETTLACASTATPAFGPDGALWLTYAAAGHILVARSADGGATFEDPIQITSAPLQLDWGPDSRPKIAIGHDGAITIAFATFKDKAFNGQVFVSHSAVGQPFTPPRPITTDPESQRFETVTLDPDGHVFAAWIDKRNRPTARAAGRKYAGAALAYTWLTGPNKGKDASETFVAKDNTCECCRLGVAFAGPGRPAVLFRNIFEGSVRDHAVITFDDARTPGTLQRVSDDAWTTEACPHHGPSLSIAPTGSYHVTWFTNGAKRQGLFYARADNARAAFAEPMPIGDANRQASRPAVIATRDAAYIVWKEFDGDKTSLRSMRSADDGRSWSAPVTVATTDGDGDHPLLIENGGRVFISWLSKGREGYRLIELGKGA